MREMIPNFGHFAYPASGLVTVIAVTLYFFLTFNVGRARGAYHVPPPATEGPPEFLRRLRVQMNTLEHMAIFLPMLWIAAFAVGDLAAAIPGIIWPVGRVMYATAYYRDPASRYPGFFTAAASSVILGVEALAGILTAF